MLRREQFSASVMVLLRSFGLLIAAFRFARFHHFMGYFCCTSCKMFGIHCCTCSVTTCCHRFLSSMVGFGFWLAFGVDFLAVGLDEQQTRIEWAEKSVTSILSLHYRRRVCDEHCRGSQFSISRSIAVSDLESTMVKSITVAECAWQKTWHGDRDDRLDIVSRWTVCIWQCLLFCPRTPSH